MGLEVLFAGVSEGAAVDVRSQLTISGFLMRGLAAQPGQQVAPAFVAVFEDVDPADPALAVGAVTLISIQISDPEGETLFYAQSESVIPPPTDPALGSRVQIVSHPLITISTVGTYSFSAEISIQGTDITRRAETTLRVVDAGQPGAPQAIGVPLESEG